MLCETLCFARLSDILHGNYPHFVATSRFIAYQAYIFYRILAKKAIVFCLLVCRNFRIFSLCFYTCCIKNGVF